MAVSVGNDQGIHEINAISLIVCVRAEITGIGGNPGLRGGVLGMGSQWKVRDHRVRNDHIKGADGGSYGEGGTKSELLIKDSKTDTTDLNSFWSIASSGSSDHFTPARLAPPKKKEPDV